MGNGGGTRRHTYLLLICHQFLWLFATILGQMMQCAMERVKFVSGELNNNEINRMGSGEAVQHGGWCVYYGRLLEL